MRLEGLNVNRTNESRKCATCNYYYFLKVNFIFMSRINNGCYDLMQKDTSFSDVSFFSVKEIDHRTHFLYMNKDEIINRISNAALKEK